MRKRVSRPPRFAAVDNTAIDTIPSILAVGLLTTLIRAKDGEEVTVESLAQSYAEGETALGKAMRILVAGGYVVKFKVQRAASEAVTDRDGKETVKRGGSWYTTFSVDSIPFTREDVAAMLADIHDGGNVKAVRVEPAHLDPRKDGAPAPVPNPPRPTPKNAGVGPNCANTDPQERPEGGNPENSGPRPTPQDAGAGRPSAGDGGALYRKKTVVKDSLSGHTGPADTSGGTGAEQDEREKPAAPGDDPAAEGVPAQRAGAADSVGGQAVADAFAAQWRRAHGTRPGRRQLAEVAAAATEAIEDGDAPDWLLGAVVPFMVARRYLDLGRAKTHRDCPLPARPETEPPARRGCPVGQCDGGGIVYRDPALQLGPRRCACRTQAAAV
ncbi:hypothetical protein [Streptomyces sp. URMC 125]|uniref:hypothetical protein n=1 Tax=Streptomyces sp. URMC 125 TaxID=3423419 RepID=UPI003F1DFF92